MPLKEIFKASIRLFFLPVILLASCDGNDPCSDIQSNAYDASFNFLLVDQTGATLIGVSGTRYESDDVTFEKEDGTVPLALTIGGSGSISFLLVDQSEPLNQLIDKNFYLMLPPTTQFPEVDIDTLNVSYLISDNNECNNPSIKDIKIQYNDSLYNSDIYPDRYNFLKL